MFQHQSPALKVKQQHADWCGTASMLWVMKYNYVNVYNVCNIFLKLNLSLVSLSSLRVFAEFLYAVSCSSSVCPAVCCSVCLSDSHSSWLYVNYPAYAGPFPRSTSVCLCSCIWTCICVNPCRQTTYGDATAPLSRSLALYAHRFLSLNALNASVCAFT